MKRVEAPCPACGAPVEFKVSSSLVTVCAHCNSAVARGDRNLEDLGKVAALVDTLSPLELGLTGVYQQKSFELVGHVQYRHASGAVWDEWYIAFSNGNYGWLAEAQGRFYVTTRRSTKKQVELPPFDAMAPGEKITIGSPPPLTVNEAGEATLIAAEGELPFRPDFQSPHRYVDLSGALARFATIDYGESPPILFVGEQVTLADIHVSPKVDVGDRAVREISAKMVACPHCGGSLQLHAPDQAELVVCPYCRSELDATQGNLKYLRTLNKASVHPLIPLGRSGTLRGESYVVIGFLQRAVTIEGVQYFWTEYLLYHQRDGFRWLVDSSGHWSFVTPVAPGEVEANAAGASYDGRNYKLYQRCPARVTYVLGEFFWKVAAGETVMVNDYIAPPHILSAEVSLGRRESGSGQAQEINFSHGVYVPREEVAQAFGLDALPGSWQIAAHQPNPVDNKVYLLFALFAFVLFGAYRLLVAIRPAGTVDSGLFFIALFALGVIPLGSFLYGRNFETRRWEDSYIE